MRLLIPVLAVLALAGCASSAPMPVPTDSPSPSASASATSPSMLPLPGTDFMLDKVETYSDDTRAPTVRFAAAHVGGEGENFSFNLTEGTWLLRVACATDASDSVDVSLEFADGRPGVDYEAYCGETPPNGIVTVTTQGPEFVGGGTVTMRMQSDSRFVAAAGFVPVG